MRITTIETETQRTAVAAAAAAARIVVRRIPTAKLIELASEVAEGVAEKYEPFTVWSSTSEDGGALLWSSINDQTPATLGGDEVTEITNLLRTAGETDPNVFGPDELVGGVWELHIQPVLQVDADDATDAVVDLLEAGDLQEEQVREVLVNVAAEHHAEHDDVSAVIDEAMAGGSETQARFLVNLLGGFGAHAELVAAA